MERRQVKAMVTKWHRAKGRNSLSKKEEDESDTRDNIDPYQANDKYLLQL